MLAHPILWTAVVSVLLSIHQTKASISLSHLSTVYLPYGYGDNFTGAEFGIWHSAVDIATYDPKGKMIYALGNGGLMFAIDASDPTNLAIKSRVDVDAVLEDVVVCEGYVFVTFTSFDHKDGGVIQFQAYDAGSDKIHNVRNVSMGPIPDRLQITKDCSTIVVALENYHNVEDNGNVTNEPAGVGFIRFPNGLDGEPETQVLNFKEFDNKIKRDALLKTGVRWIYQKDPLSDDLEPECVTINADETLAFINFQENNAIAVVDMKTPAIKDIYGLGYKDWSKHSLDPSDEDGGVHMKPWKIFGMYMPDSIQWFSWNGGDYIVTANEGHGTTIKNFTDIERAYEIPNDKYSDKLDADLQKAIKDPAMLGRLQISTIDGLNSDGKIETIYTFGSRSISIWRASDMALVYDSGSEITEKTLELRRAMFNNRVSSTRPDWSVQDGMDFRSDNAGEEPESLAVAELNDSLVIFVGVEKPGMVAVYSIPKGDNIVPQFESLYTGGVPEGREDTTWPQLYHERVTHGVDLDSVFFIPANTLADYPMLLITADDSGTVSLLKVETGSSAAATPGSAAATPGSAAATPGVAVSLLLLCLLVAQVLTSHK